MLDSRFSPSYCWWINTPVLKVIHGLAISYLVAVSGFQPAARATILAAPFRRSWKTAQVPATLSTIQSNFNGTAIPDGRTVWFNAVLKVSGVGADPVTIRLTNSTISSSAFNLVVPDAEITFSASTTQATTTFNDATNTWVTNVPSGLGGNTFLTGVAFQPPGGLPGGIKPIVWQASFSTDTPGVSVQWKWATAVYTQFSTDYNALGVKPVDSNSASQYLNSHHAGTPENFTDFVTGGTGAAAGPTSPVRIPPPSRSLPKSKSRPRRRPPACLASSSSTPTAMAFAMSMSQASPMFSSR